MAKEQEEEVIVDVEEVYSSTEKYVEENKNSITVIAGAILLIVGAYLGYTNFYLAPLEQEAQEQIWKAEQYFELDSFDLALNGDGNYFGFLAVIDEYGATKSANLSNYYAGICYLRKGEFETAIDYLKDFDSSDEMVAPVAIGAIGDCYMELGDLDEAKSYYSKAVGVSDNNFTAPLYLLKKGFACEQLGDYAAAKKAYEQIQREYPESSEAGKVDKYLSRASSFDN